MKRKWRRDWQRKRNGYNPLNMLAKSLLPSMAAAGILLGSATGVYANPAGGQIIAGSGTISQSGSTMTISQTSDKLGINWQSFSIGNGETVQFLQPGSNSIALNRVLGNDASGIYGQLIANGKVFLINPNGVLFAPGASVNVGSIVASTLNISDEDFLAGNYKFSGGEGGSVVNQGTISVANGGFAALLAPEVRNEGVIIAQQGTVALGAGKAVTLNLEGDGLLNLAVDEAALQASAVNRSLIQANGGQVIMAARAAGDLVGTVVNNSGIIKAQSINNVNGVIRLDGGAAGAVVNSGTLDASGATAGQTGGSVKVLGQNVTLADGSVLDVYGDQGGGTALIGGNYQGQGPEQNAVTTAVAQNATIKADALSGGNGGTVVVWADGATTFNGNISAQGGATGGNGGQVETSGKAQLTVGDTARVNTLAANGQAGNWLLDPSDFTIAAGGGDMTGATLSANLATGNVTILSSDGTANTEGSGNINLNDAVTADAGYTLTLKALNDVNVNSTITSTGDVILRADSDASGADTVNFGADGFVTGRHVSIYYNPVSYSDAATRSTSYTTDGCNYITSNPYQAKVGGKLTAYMLVNSVENLRSINATFDGRAGVYALNTDLDVSGISDWTPIGFSGSENSFKGIFEGDGHVISGLTINSSKSNAGLFGGLYFATVRNLGLENVKINGTFDYVGALAGSASYSTIENCYSTGTITNSGSVNGSTGGFIGQSYCDMSGWGGGITDSYSTVRVNGENLDGGYVGGFIGHSGNDDLVNCFSTGAVKVTGLGQSVNVGGLVGYLSGSDIVNSYSTGAVDVASESSWSSAGGLIGGTSGGTVQNSYSTGVVTLTDNAGFNFAGGLVGCDMGTTYSNTYTTSAVTMNGDGSFVGGFAGIALGSIANSYSTGLVTDNGSGNYVGGFLGSNGSAFGMGAAVTNCYWDVNTAGQGTGVGDAPGIAGVTGLSTAQMLDKNYLQNTLGWDFANTWYMVDGYTRPFLQSEYSTTITNAHQLQLMGMNLGASYTLGRNIDLRGEFSTASGMWNTAYGFAPVGSESGAFTGSLDGGGYAIRGLTINGPTLSALGLFGYTEGANIHDLGLTDVAINGGAANTYVGAVAGSTGASTTLTNVYTTGAVSGGQHTGGLTGYNVGDIATSYSMSVVSGANRVGGLAGTNAGTITNSYYDAGGAISGAAWDTDTSGQREGVGNGAGTNDMTGLTSEQMRDQANYPAGWDFSGVWSLSGARPLLQWEFAGATVITTLEQLMAIGSHLGGTYILGADLDLTGQWTPLGTESAAFTGILKGNGYTLNGLTITGSDAAALGLFGYTQGAAISSVNLTNVNIVAGADSLYVGGLVGYSGAGTNIKNCTSAGTLTANGDGTALGGLVGYNAGSIENSHSTAMVTASGNDSYVGGLTGYNAGDITTSYNAATVTARGTESWAGGLAGYNGGSISNSSGDLTGLVSSENADNSVGGLAGGNSGTISDSYTHGTVSTTAAATANNVGGLVGANAAGGAVSGAYGTGTVQAGGANSAVGGLVGQNAGSLSDAYSMIVTKAAGANSYVGGLDGRNSGGIASVFSVGAVLGTGTGSTAGGLVGENGGSVSNALWATDTSGQTGGVGAGAADNVRGLTFSEMLQSANFTGWDTGTWGLADGFLPYLKWQYSGAPQMTFSGIVEGEAAGRLINIVNGGTVIGQGYEFGANGLYYGVSTSTGSEGNMMLLYVAGDPAYKANGLYIAGANGLTGADLRKDTLIMDGSNGRAMNLNDLYRATGHGKLESPDLLFSCPSSNGVWYTVNGDLLARNFVLGNADSLSTTGSVTIENPGDFVINQDSRNNFYRNSISFPPDPNQALYNQQIIAGGDITITTGGNLIIKPGMANYTELLAGGDITLTAGTGFINTSGPTALSAGGRWLVYAPQQMIYSENTALYYDARAWDQTLEYTGIEWAYYAKLAQASDELGYDVRGGMSGDFTLWGYTRGDAIPAGGSGFIFTETNPLFRALTPTQHQRHGATVAAQSDGMPRWDMAGSAGVLQQSTDEELLLLTIVDQGVSI